MKGGKKSVHRRERLFGIICIGSDFRPGKVAVVAAEFEEDDVTIFDIVDKTVKNASANGNCATEASMIHKIHRKDRPFQDGIAESDDFHQWYR